MMIARSGLTISVQSGWRWGFLICGYKLNLVIKEVQQWVTVTIGAGAETGIQVQFF